MTSNITRKQEVLDRVIRVSFNVVSKSVSDDYLIRRYGDIVIDPTGSFSDPHDTSYTPFLVLTGTPVKFFTNGGISALFEDESLSFHDLLRRAQLWGDAIHAKIAAKLNALRSLQDSQNTTPITNGDVILEDVFATNDPFKFSPTGGAMRVTSKDDTPPFVDGIILNSGSAGDVRKAAMMSGGPYVTSLPMEAGVYFLSQTGKLTKTKPSKASGDKWSCSPARFVSGLSFVFLQQPPILLA